MTNYRSTVLLAAPLVALLLAASCTSDAEWAARASIARAESAAQVAAANARQLEAFAQAQTDIAKTAIWMAALPGILLLIAVLVLVIVGLWLWDRAQARRERAELARLAYMTQLLVLPPVPLAPRRSLPPAQGAAPAARRRLPDLSVREHEHG